MKTCGIEDCNLRHVANLTWVRNPEHLFICEAHLKDYLAKNKRNMAKVRFTGAKNV